MRVAIVHDWLTGMRGGERVLEGLLEIHPNAEVFTLVHVPGSVSPAIESARVHVSFLDRMPAARALYRYYLPLFPAAVGSLDLRGFDLVISSSHCVAKGARVPEGVPHVCYCHTPMRYVWDQYESYFGPGRASLPVRCAMRVVAPRLRRWDVASAERVDRFIANSRHVRERIRRHYGRDAAVVHPPVELDRFAPGGPRDDVYLTLGSPAPYKRIDLAVEAFNRMGKRLIVVGGGIQESALRRLAGPTVDIVGHVHDDEVPKLLRRCRALVLPGTEDFGIGVVEALASGTPVIALGEGGVLDTVRTEATGVFFTEPTPESLIAAVERFESTTFDPELIACSAEPFSRERFLREMREEIGRVLEAWPNRLPEHLGHP